MRRVFKIGGLVAVVLALLGVTQSASARGSHGGSSGMHSMGQMSSGGHHVNFASHPNHSIHSGKFTSFNKGYPKNFNYKGYKGYKSYGYKYGYGKWWPWYYGGYGYGYGYPSYYSYCPDCYGYGYSYPSCPCASATCGASCPCDGSVGSCTTCDGSEPAVVSNPAPVVIENNAVADGVPPLLARPNGFAQR